LARDAIRRAEKALIVEGYMDWLTMIEYGVDNAVAVSGTALTDAQAALLARFCPRITLMYDADTAGQRATLRGIDVAINAGLAVDIVTLPAGDDPDSLLRREGTDELNALIQKAPGIVEYRVDRERARVGTLDFIAQEKLAKEFLELARKIGDHTRRDAFLSEVAGYLRIPEERLRRGLGGGRPAAQAQGGTALAPSKLHDEQVFLRILFDDPRFLEKARAQVGPGDFEVDLHRRMFSTLVEQTARGIKASTPEDLGPQEDEIRLWARLISHELDSDAYERIFADVLKCFKNRRLQARRAQIKREIEQARRSGNLEEVDRLFKERLKLDHQEASGDGLRGEIGLD
jgi:DNA primase